MKTTILTYSLQFYNIKIFTPSMMGVFFDKVLYLYYTKVNICRFVEKRKQMQEDMRDAR